MQEMLSPDFSATAVELLLRGQKKTEDIQKVHRNWWWNKQQNNVVRRTMGRNTHQALISQLWRIIHLQY